MRIKAMLVTHHLPEESMPWMAEVRAVFDELIIFVDENRVKTGTVDRAKKVGSQVHLYKANAWYEWDLAAKARACDSDWVFQIEYDEQLSAEWQQGDWRRLLETTDLTHFWVPRRWIVSGQKYVRAEPWWPDLQLRLVRSNIPGTTFPSRLHDTTYVPGAGACFRNLALHHHVFDLCSRVVREERVRYYEQLRPGGGLGHYYLYEDYAAPQAPLPKPAILDISQEVIRMEALLPDEASKISLEVSEVPREVKTAAMFWPCARVTSGLDRAIHPAAPHPVRLAYHWLEKSTRKMVVFEGIRSGLFPGLEAKAAEEYDMTILAPDQPGEYILQTTIVQEGVGWFENMRSNILQEFDVSVLAGKG